MQQGVQQSQLKLEETAVTAVSPMENADPAVLLTERPRETIQMEAKQAAINKREPLLNLLREHSEGLTAEQIRGLLNAQKPMGDTLQGMRRGNLVRTEGTGREMQYFLAGAE